MKRLLACALLALVAGCGAGTTAVRTTTRAARRAATVSPAQSLLRHPTPRPPGVSLQFDYSAGAGPGSCDVLLGGPPRVAVVAQPFWSLPFRPADERLHNDRITFGQPVDVCFVGFGRGPVEVSVDEAGRRQVDGVLPRLPRSERYSDGWANFDWVPAIDDSWPLGRYTISARSGSVHATTSVNVIAPAESGLRVLGPSTDPGNNAVAPNARATVFLAGFKGVASTQLVVYRSGPTDTVETARFFSAASVPIPPSGNAVVTMATGRPDPRVTFVAVARYGRYTLSGLFNVDGSRIRPSTVIGPLPSR